MIFNFSYQFDTYGNAPSEDALIGLSEGLTKFGIQFSIKNSNISRYIETKAIKNRSKNSW